MARTKRNTRTVRTTRATALKSFVQRGYALREEGRKLAIARTRQARNAIAARAEEVRSATAGAVSKFERVFQDRVTGVISKLGIPTARDVRALSRQVAVLQQSVDQLRRIRARA